MNSEAVSSTSRCKIIQTTGEGFRFLRCILSSEGLKLLSSTLTQILDHLLQRAQAHVHGNDVTCNEQACYHHSCRF